MQAPIIRKLICMYSSDSGMSLKAEGHNMQARFACIPGVVQGPEGAGGVESVINQSAVDVLRRLPGVTEANFRPLMAAAGSLAGLADMSLPDLATAMGSQAGARRLRDWLDAVCPIQR